MSKLKAGLDGVTFMSQGCRLVGGFYKGAGDTPRPTALLLHGLPGIEKHLDLAYRLRDLGWNCLYFHYRGCWGSHGEFSLEGLTDDARAAVAWLREQPSVDKERIVLIGASTGSHPAFRCGATDLNISALVGVSPLIEPQAFEFPLDMADEYAQMLNDVPGEELLRQWNKLPSLIKPIAEFAPRPMLLVTAGHDPLFPFSSYSESLARFIHIQCVQNEASDHGFSACRSWLVQNVTDWLVARMGT